MSCSPGRDEERPSGSRRRSRKGTRSRRMKAKLRRLRKRARREVRFRGQTLRGVAPSWPSCALRCAPSRTIVTARKRTSRNGSSPDSGAGRLSLKASFPGPRCRRRERRPLRAGSPRRRRKTRRGPVRSLGRGVAFLANDGRRVRSPADRRGPCRFREAVPDAGPVSLARILSGAPATRWHPPRRADRGRAWSLSDERQTLPPIRGAVSRRREYGSPGCA